MTTAFILTRYSTDNQNPDTTAVQVKKCAEYCRQHQMTILDIFSDEAISGMRQHRPEYDRMMTQYRAGAGADVVVIYDQSRMFRDMVEWFTFRRELQALGARVISVTQPLVGGDLLDPSVFINEGAMALFNQMHVLVTRQKVGITPACAGISLRTDYPTASGRDHPRMRGDKAIQQRSSGNAWGSPPHARG